METNIPIHAGFGIGYNKATYDDTMQEFFDYACEHYSEACYNKGNIFSPFNDDIPVRTSTSFSMIFSRYLKMLKQHGPHGMISLIQKI